MVLPGCLFVCLLVLLLRCFLFNWLFTVVADMFKYFAILAVVDIPIGDSDYDVKP